MKILIAEDDRISRMFLELLLKKMGHVVTSCEDGEQAWKAYLNSDYSLVLSDWMMPEMDGLELCRRIRKVNRPPYTYFVMVTARTSKSDYLEAMDAGADDCVSKPLDKDEIEVRLRVASRILNLMAKLGPARVEAAS